MEWKDVASAYRTARNFVEDRTWYFLIATVVLLVVTLLMFCR